MECMITVQQWVAVTSTAAYSVGIIMINLTIDILAKQEFILLFFQQSIIKQNCSKSPLDLFPLLISLISKLQVLCLYFTSAFLLLFISDMFLYPRIATQIQEHKITTVFFCYYTAALYQ